MRFIINIATAAVEHEEKSGLLTALGIDWKLLLVQAASFLLLVWLLGKFVYPHIIKAIEDRRKAIEEGLSHAKKADEELKKAEAKVAELLEKARSEADEIIAHGQKEAAAMVAVAEENADRRAERIVADAQAQIQSDVQKAREALRRETISLVAEATEAVIGEKIDSKKDAGLIERALKKEQA